MTLIRITRESVERRKRREAAARRSAWARAAARAAVAPVFLSAAAVGLVAALADGEVARTLIVSAAGTAAAALLSYKAGGRVAGPDGTAGRLAGFAAILAGVLAAAGGLALAAADPERCLGAWVPPLPVAGFLVAVLAQRTPAPAPRATGPRPGPVRVGGRREPDPVLTASTPAGVRYDPTPTTNCGGCLGPLAAGDGRKACPLGHQVHAGCAARWGRCPKCGRGFV